MGYEPYEIIIQEDYEMPQFMSNDPYSFIKSFKTSYNYQQQMSVISPMKTSAFRPV